MPECVISAAAFDNVIVSENAEVVTPVSVPPIPTFVAPVSAPFIAILVAVEIAPAVNVTASIFTVPCVLKIVKLVVPECVIAAALFDNVIVSENAEVVTPVIAPPVNVTASIITVPCVLKIVKLVVPECVIAAALFDNVIVSENAEVVTPVIAPALNVTASIFTLPCVDETVRKSVILLASPVCVITLELTLVRNKPPSLISTTRCPEPEVITNLPLVPVPIAVLLDDDVTISAPEEVKAIRLPEVTEVAADADKETAAVLSTVNTVSSATITLLAPSFT